MISRTSVGRLPIRLDISSRFGSFDHRLHPLVLGFPDLGDQICQIPHVPEQNEARCQDTGAHFDHHRYFRG